MWGAPWDVPVGSVDRIVLENLGGELAESERVLSLWDCLRAHRTEFRDLGFKKLGEGAFCRVISLCLLGEDSLR